MRLVKISSGVCGDLSNLVQDFVLLVRIPLEVFKIDQNSFK